MIRIVLSDFRDEDSIAELCRKKGIAHPTLLCQFPTIPNRPESELPLAVHPLGSKLIHVQIITSSFYFTQLKPQAYRLTFGNDRFEPRA
jgi:hypothetical protein